MRREWEPEELIACRTLVEGDAVGNKSEPTRLGFALLLKFFALQVGSRATLASCPRLRSYMAQQVGAEAADLASYGWVRVRRRIPATPD